MKTENGRMSMCTPAESKRRQTAFTLIELLVVIGIIALLAAIIIPVAGKMQKNAKAAASQAFIAQLSGAIEQYQQLFHAYPGPLSNDQIYTKGTSLVVPPIYSTTGAFITGSSQISGSENLVLGLCGGLRYDTATAHIIYDSTLLGSGPRELLNVKTYPPFMQNDNISTGHFKDDIGDADDSDIPEFVDQFSKPMPILYLRCRRGVSQLPTSVTQTVQANDIFTNNTTGPRVAPYDLSQIISYTGAFNGTYPNLTADTTTDPASVTGVSIGEGKDVPQYYYNSDTPEASKNVKAPPHGLRTVNNAAVSTPPGTNYYYPYDAYAYFKSPAVPTSPRQKDGYILISAGKDRIYGTDDDLTSFGSVTP